LEIQLSRKVARRKTNECKILFIVILVYPTSFLLEMPATYVFACWPCLHEGKEQAQTTQKAKLLKS